MFGGRDNMKFKELREATLTKTQIKKVHDKADDLPKNDFIKRYGKDGDSVRFATATKMVKKELGIEDYEEGFKSDAQRKAAYASGYKEQGTKTDEALDDKDKETIKPIIKQLQKSVKAHDKQAKQLQKDIQDEVEITEAISDAQVAQIARMTDRNDHFGVRIEIARLMKDKQLMSFYDSLEKMHMTSQIQNAIGNDAVSLRGKLEKVLKVRMKQRFGDKDSKRIMDAL